MRLKDLATDTYRWVALLFLSLGLAIVIIDNTVLNVAIPYILRDLNTSLDTLQWTISGYALIIATLLITMGRLGDMFGRKRIFIIGLVFFAVGSLIASFAEGPWSLFVGEALIEAIGAAMMMTSSLSLLVSEFQGRERPIAFGIWGSVAGASAALGPLLGGYLTTYFSWRWSLRINVFVAIFALLGTVFIKESKGDQKGFDWPGTILSGLGLFALVFALIEGRIYGWTAPVKQFSIGSWTWPATNISIIPFAFWFAAVCLALFVVTEYFEEKEGRAPMLQMSLFGHSGFSIGLLTLGIVSLGQFGAFFVLPIFLQSALGFDAWRTGLAFLAASITMFVMGPVSGFLASKFKPKWIVSIGMFILAGGLYYLERTLSLDTSIRSLIPSLIVFGLGAAMTAAQLTNVILSAVPARFAGEASAANSTVRQVGTTIGIAVLGTVLAGTLATGIRDRVGSDPAIPAAAREEIVRSFNPSAAERGENGPSGNMPPQIAEAVKRDVNEALLASAQEAMRMAFWFILVGAVISLFIPSAAAFSWDDIPDDDVDLEFKEASTL
jgi:EmrB/QacA subfamily drug resistance transporter